ncbi:MAG: integrase [Deltaproteobacteria bacterium HGW-Deltaproteobacteria-8]|nr:MAG: integrase [Deltaproteobacteria bacterium HGW-Deltaproteobacteria-8]
MGDSLLYAIGRARMQGSAKTRYQHRAEAARFVCDLRAAGHGVQSWRNISNKHVAVVIERWRARGLGNATIKEYLSGVRAVARAYGNDTIRTANDFRGDDGGLLVGPRIGVDNCNRAVPEKVYAAALEVLRVGTEDAQRFAIHLRLMRTGGLRHEEARKLNPLRCLLADGRVFISDGTKGGRERMISAPSPAFLTAIEDAHRVVSRHGNLMPDGMNERQWEKRAYAFACAAGISQAVCGASLHGLRHAYAQERYASITGFQCASAGGKLAEAMEIAGTAWRQLDSDARLLIKAELGHGPDRDDVVARYLGSRFRM